MRDKTSHILNIPTMIHFRMNSETRRVDIGILPSNVNPNYTE